MSSDGGGLDPMRATRVDATREGARSGALSCATPSRWYVPRRGMTDSVSPEVLRFGRYQGRAIADVDDRYLYWLVRRAGLYDSTRQSIRDELRRRAGRRRSWRPVVRAVYGRQLLDVNGRGPFAVVQSCGADRRELTVVLHETAEQAQAEREQDCGYEGPDDCQPARHLAVDLRDWTLLRRSTVPRRSDLVIT